MSIMRFQKIVTMWGNVFTLICLLLANSGSVQIVQAAAGDTIRVSAASRGGDSASISADGRYIAFRSFADDLVSGDTNGRADIFVYDRQSGQTTRVSVASDGTEENADSGDPSISADGRYVAFDSYASNLVSGDTNGNYDVFVHDLQSGQTTRVSVASDGTQVDNFTSNFPHGSQVTAISADGRYVAFGSSASDLVPADTNDAWDVFVHDLQSGQTTRVSVASDGTQGNGDIVYWPSISADGRYVAFDSSASNLVPGDTNNFDDTFVHDRQSGQTTRISVASDGTQGNSATLAESHPLFSANGRYVTFTSLASNLVSGDTNGVPDIFVHDLQSGRTTRISVASDGMEGNGTSAHSSLSTDGRYVAFDSAATNLVGGDTNGVSDVFIHDQLSGRTTRVSGASDGTQGNNNSGFMVGENPLISSDGRYVVFTSLASNLVSGDMNGTWDIFVHENEVPIESFLDLPIRYTDFSSSANGKISNNVGRVNSWFDHSLPNYSANKNLTKWNGSYFDFTQQGARQGLSWYDGHNGIDFSHDQSQSNEPIYAAANGIVINTSTNPLVSNCQNSVSGCTSYGNRVWVDHGNRYATLYGHLASVLVTKGTPITNRLAQPLGIMGSTGRSTGTHLHFGLYYDQNKDGKWTEDEVVDPYGWLGASPDPWNIPSTYLWIHSLSSELQFSTTGGSVSTPSGLKTVTIPPGALNSSITLQVWDAPPIAAPSSAQLRSIGNSLWMQIKAPSSLASVSANIFNVPMTVTINFDPSTNPHIDINQSAIQRWDEAGQVWIPLATTIDTNNNRAYAQTTEPGYFDLQGPLVCPTDTLEPNDNYDGSSSVPTDGSPVGNLFDIAQDEDWFQFEATANNNYTINTVNLSTGVDTILEVYDTNGLTLFASDDNSGGSSASSLTWQAPGNGTYFVRARQGPGSAYGCTSSYEINILNTPTVLSINRADPSPTDAASVHFTVKFSEAVTGVDTVAPFNDFAPTTTGVSDASITDVAGSGDSYTVTVNTGSGDGTIRLDVVDDNTIISVAGDPLGGAAVGDGDFTTGEVYNITDKATIINRDLDLWNAIYLGFVSDNRFEKWQFEFTETHSFVITASPILGGLVPMLILLDADGNELARGTNTLTSTQPTGTYYVQIQPESGNGIYSLTIREIANPPPSVSTSVNPSRLNVGGSSLIRVNLNYVPAEGYTSAEFTCNYDQSLLEESNITVGSLFGADTVVAINGPQNGRFIVAMAGSNGNKATTSGSSFTFNVKALQGGQTSVECTARVSKGDGNIISLPSTGAAPMTLIGGTITSTFTPTVTPTGSATPTVTATSTETPAPPITSPPTDVPIQTSRFTETTSATLTASQTPTPSFTSESPTPTASQTATPTASPTDLTPGNLQGQVLAAKQVTVKLNGEPIPVNLDGTFSHTTSAGTYPMEASAEGFLSAAGSASITSGGTTTMPTITLLAGDIDNNNVIDQFDAITIGMNYNTLAPTAADLNNDGVINFLDLELLAKNYRMTGPVTWQ